MRDAPKRHGALVKLGDGDGLASRGYEPAAHDHIERRLTARQLGHREGHVEVPEAEEEEHLVDLVVAGVEHADVLARAAAGHQRLVERSFAGLERHDGDVGIDERRRVACRAALLELGEVAAHVSALVLPREAQDIVVHERFELVAKLQRSELGGHRARLTRPPRAGAAGGERSDELREGCRFDRARRDVAGRVRAGFAPSAQRRRRAPHPAVVLFGHEGCTTIACRSFDGRRHRRARFSVERGAGAR